MISAECARAADLLAIKREHANKLAANGHNEISRGVLTGALREAIAAHATCVGCDCQCLPPEVKSGNGSVPVTGTQGSAT